MRHITKVFSLFLAIMLLIAGAASAESVKASMDIQSAILYSDRIEAIAYISGGFNRKGADNFSATLGKSDAGVIDYKEFSASEYGTSYVIIIDGKKNWDSLLNAEKDLALACMDFMSRYDDCAVLNTASESLVADARTVAGARLDVGAIAKFDGENSSLRLYDAIDAAVSYLNTATSVKERRAIIAISNGDDGGSAVTFNTLKDNVKASGIPVYTAVFFSGKSDAEAGLNRMKELSQATPGGASATVNWSNSGNKIDDIAPIADAIARNESDICVVSIGVEDGAQARGETLMLSFQYDNTRLSDSFAIAGNADVITVVEAEVEPEIEPEPWSEPQIGAQPEETSAPDATPANEATPEATLEPASEPSSVTFSIWPPSDENIYVWLIAGIAILLIMIVLIILATRKKAPAPAVEIASEPSDESEACDGPMRQKTKPMAEVFGYYATITDPRTGKKAQIRISDRLIIGRNSKYANYVIDDVTVSEKHLEIYVDCGMVYARDLNSTNGTKLDGNPITGPVQLQPKSRLKLGNTEIIVEVISTSN